MDLLLLEGDDEEARDAFTSEEVFELIRNLNDPEHPLTLEQLKVATVRRQEGQSRCWCCVVPPVDSIQLYLTPPHILSSQLDNVKVDDNRSTVRIWFTPTIPHCR